MARHRRADDESATSSGPRQWAEEHFVEARERLQYQRNPDFNGERIDGVGFAPLNVHNGWRRSTAVGYLRPNLCRKNLGVDDPKPMCGKILFEGTPRGWRRSRARRKRLQRIGARRELILSGGAINTPVLLLASGIGPAAELAQHGIEVKLRCFPASSRTCRIITRPLFRLHDP